jgi:hypothetical protein
MNNDKFENTENQEQNNDKLFDILKEREKKIHEPVHEQEPVPDKQPEKQPENPLNSAIAEMLAGKINMANKIIMRVLNKDKTPVDISDDGQEAIQKWLEFELKRMPAETTLIWIMRISALLGIGESWYIYLTSEQHQVIAKKQPATTTKRNVKQMELVKQLKTKKDENNNAKTKK